jgi:hypothetical protein
MYPCKNHQQGCNEILSFDDKASHESTCLYEKIVCPFKKLWGGDCIWTGILSEVVDHVRCDHGCQTQNSLGFFVLKLENICASKRHTEAVFVLGELFFLVWEFKECNIHFAVFHTGSKTATGEFFYKFRVKRNNEKISMTAICHSYLEDTSAVLQPGECVVLPYGALLKYLSKDSDLSCEVKIRKCQNSSVFTTLSKWFEDHGPSPSLRPNTAPTSTADSPEQLPEDSAQYSKIQNP